MSDSFDKHIEIQHANKPYFVALKRIWRLAKKIPNPDKPKKLGFYLQSARKIQGSAQINEKIIKDIFGKTQQMSPSKFIEGVFEHGVPEGKKLYIKPETAYQTTQRLIPDERSDSKVGLNKTIQVSIFGDIYDKILNKYKGRKDADDLFRAVNKYLSSHFANAAGFVRWTNVNSNWIHIDAFQTDFFSNLKSMAYKEKDNPEIQKIVSEFRKYEDEFFKTAVSYIVRTNPSAKIFTASTPEIVAAVENIRGEVKLKKYYYKLPKKLGFKLIDMSKLNQILRTRPGKKAEALIKKFSGAISKATGKSDKTTTTSEVKNLNTRFADIIGRRIGEITKTKYVSPEQVDAIINSNISRGGNPALPGAFHQHIEEIALITKKNFQAKTPDKNKQEIKEYLDSKISDILAIVNKTISGVGSKIWWANKELIFEQTISHHQRKKILKEEIKQLSRY